MVWLDRIYTRSGDDGTTGLGDGSRVSKLDARVVAGGTVDETNCAIGLARTIANEAKVEDLLLQIQQRLFDLGADVCRPLTADEQPGDCLRVTSADVAWLEATIDEWNEGLPPLTSFVLPGGSAAAAWLHQARAVCRRAERDVLALADQHAINDQVGVFLNRLSDLLFVLARICNAGGTDEVMWQPGAAR
ncbi:MAG: cob(I)yrinic acid a,c-diamide adenosyltransferase [Fuerstiella sp.]